MDEQKEEPTFLEVLLKPTGDFLSLAAELDRLKAEVEEKWPGIDLASYAFHSSREVLRDAEGVYAPTDTYTIYFKKESTS